MDLLSRAPLLKDLHLNLAKDWPCEVDENFVVPPSVGSLHIAFSHELFTNGTGVDPDGLFHLINERAPNHVEVNIGYGQCFKKGYLEHGTTVADYPVLMSKVTSIGIIPVTYLRFVPDSTFMVGKSFVIRTRLVGGSSNRM